VKCDQCGYISFDYNHACPACGNDLAVTRAKLGITYEPPEASFEDLFRIPSSTTDGIDLNHNSDAREVILDGDDDFEFTLDD
jgi:hypothetical protein